MTRHLLLAAVSAGMLLASLFAANPLSNAAQGYTRQIVASTVAVYATLRTVNAFLSTAQEVEVGGSLVVSGTVQPLKVLEPLDDTVERVAGLVFLLSIGAGLLSLSFAPLAGIGFGLIVLAFAFDLFGRLPEVARALRRYGLALGVVLPLAFALAGLAADAMTQRVWQTHEAILTEISSQMAPATVISEARSDGRAPETPVHLGDGWLDQMLSGLITGTSAVTGAAVRMADATRVTFEGIEDYAQAAQVIVSRADELVASFINIVGVFLFKALVLPLALAGALFAMLRPFRP